MVNRDPMLTKERAVVCARHVVADSVTCHREDIMGLPTVRCLRIRMRPLLRPCTKPLRFRVCRIRVYS